MSLSNLVNSIKKENRFSLLEHEIYTIFKNFGINVPNFKFLSIKSYEDELKDFDFSSSQLVVKVVSCEIMHKTDIGGVKFCNNNRDEILASIKSIIKNTKAYNVKGFLIVERLNYKKTFSSEILLSLRHTDDYEYLINFGSGGVNTEIFGKNLNNSFSIFLAKDFSIKYLEDNIIFKHLTGHNREKKVYIDKSSIGQLIKSILSIKDYFTENGYIIKECEVNPFVLSSSKLFALDGILSLKPLTSGVISSFNKEKFNINMTNKIDKIQSLIKPKTICIAGVSSKSINMGRIILNNIIKSGFNKDDLIILKEGETSIDGVKCVSNISSIKGKLDLFVMAVNAKASVKLIEELVKHDKAKSVILIPGGFAETSTGKSLEEELKNILNKSTNAPVLVGGNCLGVISYPGKYNTFFIPESKLKYSSPKPYAFISQSGAFIISKLSKTDLTPKVAISIGNQVNLTVSDYLDYFYNDKNTNVIALYIEGFKSYDGIRSALKIKGLTSMGKKVIVYKAGRSKAGNLAASGHTASIAGSYENFESIFKHSGAIIADNFSEFEDLLKLSVHFTNVKIDKVNLAIMSNAGFETVGMSDSLKFLPNINEKTIEKLKSILSDYKIDSLVDIHNPLDVTPVANDKVYFECFKALLDDDNISAGVLSCIPMTGAIKSLKGEFDSSSIFNLINGIKTNKPFVFVVDSGKLYDYACEKVKNVPVFRESDRAIKAIIKYFNN